MRARNSPTPLKALVWRISEDAPLGEWVDRSTPVRQPSGNDASESQGAWASSSFDLLSGTDVVENDDTIPGDLLDDLFGRNK